MSQFYLVHKDDADRYDAMNAECSPIRDEYSKKLDEQRRNINRDHEYYQNEMILINKLDDYYMALINPVLEKYNEKTIRAVHMFNEQPKDKENYLVYYRGRRFANPGDQLGKDAMGMQDYKFKQMKDLIGKITGESDV